VFGLGCAVWEVVVARGVVAAFGFGAATVVTVAVAALASGPPRSDLGPAPMVTTTFADAGRALLGWKTRTVLDSANWIVPATGFSPAAALKDARAPRGGP